MDAPLFSAEEIAEMEQRTVDRLTQAIEAGDTERAKRLAQRMYNEFTSMHDLYRDWIAATLSTVGRTFGTEALETVMTEGVKAWWLPNLEKLPTGQEHLRQRIKMFVAGLHGHLQPLHIEEDDEKVVIQMQPCGSGGRLVQEGKYDGPNAFLTLDTPHKLTYGRDEFPVYCAHEPPMEWLDIAAHGAPFVVVEPSKHIGAEPCSFLIYKDPAKVPAKYYERLGLTKPATS